MLSSPSVLRSGVARVCGCGVVRWRSVQAQPARAAPDELVDVEWESAKPFDALPGPTVWQLIRGFASGGRYADLSILDLHKRLHEEYGQIFRMPGILGRRDIVMSFNPTDFEKVFRSEGTWPVRRGMDAMVYYRETVRPDVFGELGGLVTEQGEHWQKMRTIVNPVMMQPKTVKLYVDQVDEVAREFMNIVAGLRDSKYELPRDFDQWINRWALETMGVLSLDSRLGVLQQEQTAEAKTILALVRGVFDGLYKFEMQPSIWRYYQTASFKRLMKTFNDLTNLIMVKIDRAVVKFEKSPTSEGNQSVLEKLLKINKHVAVIMALEMIMAGIDTVSAGTTGILYCLAKNPEKQAKLRDELRTIMPRKDSPLTADNTRNLPYLRACIKEAMRLYPPTAGNFRATGRNLVMQGYRIPKDTDIAMGSLVLQHNDEFYARAKDFLPERWLAERDDDVQNAKESHPFIFLPFGFGPRSCIGKRLAMMEMEVFIARAIRRFETRWNYEDFKIRVSLINIPANQLRFEMKEVDH